MLPEALNFLRLDNIPKVVENSGGYNSMEETKKMNTKKIGAIIGLLVVLSFLVGCSSGQNATATSDPKLIYTQVAQTVQAQLANAITSTPKFTNTPLPTDVPLPTATKGTPNPTTAVTLGTAAATKAAGTPGTAVPTLKNTIPVGTGSPVTVPDKMLYVSQGVPDNTKFKSGDQFSMSWTIKNVGTSTWDNTYRVRFFGGTRLGVQDFTIPQTVKPGATVKLSVEMTAPSSVGQYNSIWVLTNPDGVNFGNFNFACEVK